MGVSCKIYIKKPREGIHRAGQPISGILNYVIDEPTEYQDAVLSLIGSAKCRWTERGSKQRHTFTGEEEFLSMQFNILNKPSDETVTIPAGAYEFRFEFILPYDIPSSFEDEYCHVKYQVKAKFEKPSFFSRARKFEKQITVYGNVTPTTPAESHTYELRKKLFKLCSSTKHIVDLKVRISKSFLTPGESATLEITVNNDSNTEIQYLAVELICRTTYLSERILGKRTKKFDNKVDDCGYTTQPFLPYTSGSFACEVPTLPNLYSIQNCKIINKEYFVKVTVHLPCPHINARCFVPIVIGEGRYGDCSGFVELDDTNQTGVEPSTDASPPSYWEVMDEDKAPEGKIKQQKKK